MVAIKGNKGGNNHGGPFIFQPTNTGPYTSLQHTTLATHTHTQKHEFQKLKYTHQLSHPCGSIQLQSSGVKHISRWKRWQRRQCISRKRQRRDRCTDSNRYSSNDRHGLSSSNHSLSWYPVVDFVFNDSGAAVVAQWCKAVTRKMAAVARGWGNKGGGRETILGLGFMCTG